MKRDEYLDELKKELIKAEFPHVEEAMTYFSEMLDDRIADENLDEEAAIGMLEEPGKAAQNLAMQLDKTPGQAQKPEEQAEDSSPGVRALTLNARAVRSILIRDRNLKLIVEGWERDEVVVEHPETRKIRYETRFEDGAFSLIRSPVEFSLDWFTIDPLAAQMRQVRLRVPHELAAVMDLKTSNAKITIEKVNCWGKLDLLTSNGAVKLNEVGAKSLYVRTSNAGIILEKVKVQKTVDAHTSNGKVTAEGVLAPESLVIKTSNGKIDVSTSDSPVFSFTTSNGPIHAGLPGSQKEYSITSQTSNSKNNLPYEQAGGPRSLFARTSNGKIDVVFLGGPNPA